MTHETQVPDHTATHPVPRPLDATKVQVVRKPGPPTLLPPLETLSFGGFFTDHMLEVNWTAKNGWDAPRIVPFQDLHLHPACSALHYGLQVFEGLKAFRNPDNFEDDNIYIFRPEMNAARLNRSCARSGLPQVDEIHFLTLLRIFVSLESDFVPKEEGYSLYLRPMVFATQPTLGVAPPQSARLIILASPVGPYFPEGFKPVRLMATTEFVRAWPGGTGDIKSGGNYAASVVPQQLAREAGCQQVLWLFPDSAGVDRDYYVTEAGTMNMFILWINEAGEKELTTFPLTDNLILAGVTRDSLLTIAAELEFTEGVKIAERKVRMMKDLLPALWEDRVLEIFGSGTACSISPINGIYFEEVLYGIPLGERNVGSAEGIGPYSRLLLNKLQAIQRGQIPKHPWNCVVKPSDGADCSTSSQLQGLHEDLHRKVAFPEGDSNTIAV